jgi:hypothetical protein
MSRGAIAASGLLVTAVMAQSWSPIGRYFNVQVDYATHTKLAEEIVSDGITFPHFLWHVLVVAVHTTAPWLSWMEAAQAVVVASYGLQGAVLAWVVTTLVARPRHAGQAVAVVLLAFLLVIVAPVTILTWRERALYFGYLNMESYASPTQALLKPLALLMFVFTARGLVDGGRLRDGLVLGSTTVLSALAKPTLHICLVPATIIMMAWGWLRGRRRHTIYLACAVIAPAFVILLGQYLLYFGSGEQHIVFAPLVVMGYFATGLGVKFVMSILLPVTVLLVYRRQIFSESAMPLAWLQFALGAAYTYLLAESRYTLSGNFAWSGQIATYLLFVMSTIFALRHRAGRIGSAACALAFALHAVSGVLFFLYPGYWGTVPSR